MESLYFFAFLMVLMVVMMMKVWLGKKSQ